MLSGERLDILDWDREQEERTSAGEITISLDNQRMEDCSCNCYGHMLIIEKWRGRRNSDVSSASLMRRILSREEFR